MSNKFNKVIATGLIALQIANFSACDTIGPEEFASNDSNDETTINETNGSSTGNHFNVESEPLYGDVWKLMVDNGKAYTEHYAGITHQIDCKPLPLQFLQEVGLVYYDENGKACVVGNQYEAFYEPLYAEVYVDKESAENDVYVLLRYQDAKMANESDEKVYVASWKLKYVLDDADYETLLKLKDDFRQRFFIQEMDNIYEPEVISKSIAVQDCIVMGSPFRSDNSVSNTFPNVYIDSIDYDNKTVTFGAWTGEGFVYYDDNLYQSNAWDSAITMYGLTEEQRAASVKMTTKNTILGQCLTEFSVYGIRAGLTNEQAKEAVRSSTKVHKLECLEANSVDIDYTIGY